MKNQFLTIALILAGCNAPTLQAPAPTPAPATPEITPPQAAQPEVITPKTVTLSVFTLSKTAAPVNGWPTKTYTAKASCVMFNGQSFCWDDGLKTLMWSQNNFTYGPFMYSYFGQSAQGPCSGGCTDDADTSPKVMSGQAVNDIFNLGVRADVECTETDGHLDCGTFTI